MTAVHYEDDYPDDTYREIAEAEADARGRLTLSKAGARPGRKYRVESTVDGVIRLTPIIAIPEREMIVWENPELAESIREGLQAVRKGKTADLGDFSQYLHEDDDED